MEFFELTNEVIALITGLVSLIGMAISAFFAVKLWVKNLKTKNKQEIWSLIMEMADAAMTEAEQSNASGEDKKRMVIDALTASAKAAGLEIGEFTTQLNDYIDQTISFVNKMKTK